MSTPTDPIYKPPPKYECDPDIEYCATVDIFPEEKPPIDSTPLILVGCMLIWNGLAPLVWYFVRMSFRQVVTGTYSSTNMVDVGTNILWVLNLVFFIFGFILWPFHWLENESVDYVIAWMLVNLYADGTTAIAIIFFLYYLIVAFTAGTMQEQICETIGLVQTCYYNKGYLSPTDGWLSWLFFTIGAGLSYFVTFWFGGDAIRYLRPNGGYNLYFLYPSVIYDLMVITGVAPDADRSLTGHEELFGNAETTEAETEATSAAEGDAASDGNESPFVEIDGPDSLLAAF